MDQLNNNVLIHYSEYLLKNYTKIWYKIFTRNKRFFPYVMYNLQRNLNNYPWITDELLSTVNDEILLTSDPYLGTLIKIINVPEDVDNHRDPFDYHEIIRLAAISGYLNVIKELEPYNPYKDYENAIEHAANFGHVDIIKFLVPVDSIKNYYQAIKSAVNNNYVDIVEYLLQIEDFDNDDDYLQLLEIAIEKVNLPMVKIIEPYIRYKNYKSIIQEINHRKYMPTNNLGVMPVISIPGIHPINDTWNDYKQIRDFLINEMEKINENE